MGSNGIVNAKTTRKQQSFLKLNQQKFHKITSEKHFRHKTTKNIQDSRVLDLSFSYIWFESNNVTTYSFLQHSATPSSSQNIQLPYCHILAYHPYSKMYLYPAT